MYNSLLAPCRSIPITIITICVLHIRYKLTHSLRYFQIKGCFFVLQIYVVTLLYNMSKRIRHMEGLNKVLAGFLCALVLCSIIGMFSTCSVARKIDWHERQLDKYEKLYPEMFTTAGIDSLIKAKALELVGQMYKEVDPVKLDSLETELVKLHKWVATAKENGTPCDTILVEVEKIVEKQGKTKEIWRDAPCVLDTIRKDSAGVHVRAWGSDGKLYMKLSVDSIRIKYDCPPEPICAERKFWEFWEFWVCPAFLVLLVIIIARRKI